MQVLSWIGRRLGGGWRSKAEKPIEQNIGPPVTFNENIARKSWNNSEYIEIPKPLRPLFLDTQASFIPAPAQRTPIS